MSWVIGSTLSVLAILILVPRRLLRDSTRQERRVVSLVIAARTAMPLVAEYMGKNSARFFRGGGWDSEFYHEVGSRIFDQLSAGFPATGHLQVPGTGAIQLATGYLYLIVGSPSRMVAVYVCTMIATIGNLLFWLATRDSVVGRRGSYAAWVLLAPTLLFWSSTLSKEAPILLGLGCLVMALRRSLSRQFGGRFAVYLVVGVLSIGFIRPFVTLILFTCFGVASLIARSNRQIGERPGGRFLMFILVLGGLAISAGLSGELLNVQAGQSVIEAAYDRAESTSSGQGFSAYAAEPVRSPLQVPGALSIVLLRPYIWETRTVFQVLASLESLALLTIGLLTIGALIQGRRRIRWDSLTLTSALYVILFSSAISTYGNFGLVVRQRAQVWQFVIFLAFCTVPVLKTQFRANPRFVSVLR